MRCKVKASVAAACLGDSAMARYCFSLIPNMLTKELTARLWPNNKQKANRKSSPTQKKQRVSRVSAT